MNDDFYTTDAETEETAEAAEAAETAGTGENSEETSSDEGKTSTAKEIVSWIKTIAFAVILAWFITTFLIVNAKVPTGSMKNTINEGDRVIANRLSYLLSDPERFDIVVFKFPDNEKEYFIKRIIGLPGETVEIKDGKVYIDGSDEPLDDSFIAEPMIPEADAVYEVPENCYFMLGDNRNNSADSRRWVNKYVKREKILGKAVLKYFPSIELMTDK